MGAPRFCCRKLEYGSIRDSSVPSRLKTLTVCEDVPLGISLVMGYAIGAKYGKLTLRTLVSAHGRLLS